MFLTGGQFAGALLEDFLKCDDVSPKGRVCVVSIIGKSAAGYDSCKGAIVDEAVGRNVFRGKFNEKRTMTEPYVRYLRT